MVHPSWLFACVTCVLLDFARSAALQSMGVKNTLYDVPGLGNRPVKIRVIPAIENVRSTVYEVYAEPYAYDLDARVAIAVLQPAEEDSSIKGEIMFIQHEPPVGPTIIRGNITGLPAGRHGLHIHRSGDQRQGCEKIGPHFNPYAAKHGAPPEPFRHVGDLGNVEAGEDGTADVNRLDPLVSLSLGRRGVVGRALVVTMDPDDLGLGGTAESLEDGNSGKPVACGVIAYIR